MGEGELTPWKREGGLQPSCRERGSRARVSGLSVWNPEGLSVEAASMSGGLENDRTGSKSEYGDLCKIMGKNPYTKESMLSQNIKILGTKIILRVSREKLSEGRNPMALDISKINIP